MRPRARLRCSEHQASRRRHGHDDRRGRDVPDRPARPSGRHAGLIALAGGGALLLFLGTASVSSTVAKPVTKLLGWPVAKVYKAPGQLAAENAGRAPRRTSATVAALMIGVALVSAAAVFAASLRTTFTDMMDRGVTADWVVTAGGFALLPDVVAQTLADVPELSAVTGVRSVVPVEIDGDEKQFGAADPVALEQLVNVGLEDGSWEGLQEGGIFVHNDPPRTSASRSATTSTRRSRTARCASSRSPASTATPTSSATG